eukprot:CAMPEP_0185607326 /NCGR_PEP_ID=MMETSP0436-20130131/5433_1 /TAXON_ID=626734 ORGANISM="Favella taraikaensis, Strain Fe Narragansett Bay" /NCGR_SAMPLE_ID=MMETSP0436 /ASSEMBLY_ACC=CAM_ASM_000390 /LENGTH=175 /DNA_ID=CAMNT_0028239221 /DNA_START=1093 /DNA_END=1620 /DNA_ORIENTATION=-
MVESLYAVAADGAVSAATGSDGGAVRAELRAVDQIKHVHKIDLIVLDVARLHARRTREEEECQEKECKVQAGCPPRNIWKSEEDREQEREDHHYEVDEERVWQSLHLASRRRKHQTLAHPWITEHFAKLSGEVIQSDLSFLYQVKWCILVIISHLFVSASNEQESYRPSRLNYVD